MSSSKSEKEAMKKARILVSKMKTKGWKIRVWENLGWHYEIMNGLLSVDSYQFRNEKERYHAMLLDKEGEIGSSPCFWYDSKRFRDPNQAVNYTLKNAENFVSKL